MYYLNKRTGSGSHVYQPVIVQVICLLTVSWDSTWSNSIVPVNYLCTLSSLGSLLCSQCLCVSRLPPARIILQLVAEPGDCSAVWFRRVLSLLTGLRVSQLLAFRFLSNCPGVAGTASAWRRYWHILSCLEIWEENEERTLHTTGKLKLMKFNILFR